MKRRDLTDEERQHWQEATSDTKRTRSKAKAPKAEAPLPRPAMRHEAPVAPSRTPSTPLAPLARRAAQRQFKPHAQIEATIDLHGMTQHEAHEALLRFLARAIAGGKRHLAIITGKGSRGEGVLRRAVPQWLEAPEWRGHISAIAHAAPEKGGEGVLHVLLKKPS